MKWTAYHAKYVAYELTKRYPSDSIDKFAGTLADARVDLNPHQIDAALFAFSSPFSKGALLADEVGLGKTIEAGLVIAQRWAERKRRLLVIVPSNLRKQWFQELSEKFFLPCRILESRNYNHAIQHGHLRPFIADEIVITSYHFAWKRVSDLASVPWDLVVIDEAHRLRNVYRSNNRIASALKSALASAPKILLTATPLQNNLLELYGLVSFIDDHIFGDVQSFRERFMSSEARSSEVFDALRERLKYVCHRTLRRQVTPYISYTKRHPIVEYFTPEEAEDRLYHLVSDYLQRPNLQALRSGQRSLMILVLRKLLASSTFAIAGALETILRRLKKTLQRDLPTLQDELREEYESLDSTAEEWGEDEPPTPLTNTERAALEQEIQDLTAFRDLAVSIQTNAKGQALLKVLSVAFQKTAQLGGAQKAIIFTESRQTQAYLQRLLAGSPWREGVILFNGVNNDARSKAIYAEWLEKNGKNDRVTGSKTADLRSALVDAFREEGQILIATEAGAEGINLQFCSLVINYDLPWNPQRIEQRIGRSHRYGQTHDVVVVNFVNRANAADQRVFELLSKKFQLFEGVFGSSDEVLGVLSSGVDFEKRIADIYQTCRRSEEIQDAFDKLQAELSGEINDALSRTRQKILEHFDDEVREKLKLRDQSSKDSLDRFERYLLNLARYELQGLANFCTNVSFLLHSFPDDPTIPLGVYVLPRIWKGEQIFRRSHPLAELLLSRAKERPLGLSEIQFDYSAYQGKISVLEPFLRQAGWLELSLFSASTPEDTEESLILVAFTDQGEVIPSEIAQRFFSLSGRIVSADTPHLHQQAEIASPKLQHLRQIEEASLLTASQRRTSSFLDIESAKLDRWSDDQKFSIERDIRDLDRQIRDARKGSTSALTLEAKIDAQRQIQSLETTRSQKRKDLFALQDQIDHQRTSLIDQMQSRLHSQTSTTRLFSLRWLLL